MNPSIAVPMAFFVTVITLSIVVPVVRANIRRQERNDADAGLTPELSRRLDRIESMVETVAIEVERLAEGQRFTTRLLSEGAARPVMDQQREAEPMRRHTSEVTP